MTAEALGNVLRGWISAASEASAQMQDDFARLTGVQVDFGAHPVPSCPACGWTSAKPDQSDFQVEGPGTTHHLGPHIHFTGCGHRWAITDIKPISAQSDA
ncbi:hypothetical protein ACFYZ8_34425 [Streptomyces sp. NPDC001668]|uniref:hypothetical protein n=1 Tax=Streptomyces sp. NPDC001668 TaxID=3364598 RepID=UPI0036ADA979